MQHACPQSTPRTPPSPYPYPYPYPCVSIPPAAAAAAVPVARLLVVAPAAAAAAAAMALARLVVVAPAAAAAAAVFFVSAVGPLDRLVAAPPAAAAAAVALARLVAVVPAAAAAAAAAAVFLVSAMGPVAAAATRRRGGVATATPAMNESIRLSKGGCLLLRNLLLRLGCARQRLAARRHRSRVVFARAYLCLQQLGVSRSTHRSRRKWVGLYGAAEPHQLMRDVNGRG